MKRILTSLFILAALTSVLSGCRKENGKLEDATVSFEVSYSDENASTREYADIYFSLDATTILSVTSTKGSATKSLAAPGKAVLACNCKVKDGFVFDPEENYALLFSAVAFITVKDKEGNIVSRSQIDYGAEQRSHISGEKASYLMKDILSEIAISYNCIIDSDGTITLYKLDK